MAYTNSSLATYKPLGKNHYNGRSAILGIVPHCVVGSLSINDAWGYFHGIDNASCNYYIDANGNIACFVDEKYGAWTTSSYTCDMNHITVECASGKTDPYTFTDATYKALIKLTADVYKRNGIKACYWESSKAHDSVAGYVPMHRNYKNKACPGDWLVAKYQSGDFCKQVNALLNGGGTVDPKQVPGTAVNSFGIYYKAHMQSYGWQDVVHDGQVAGISGASLRMEALRITMPEGTSLNVKAHIQRTGWVEYNGSELEIGTTGHSLRIEGIEMTASGIPEGKTFKYRVHVQGIGWMDWTKSGFFTGTVGQSKRIEAIQIEVV